MCCNKDINKGNYTYIRFATDKLGSNFSKHRKDFSHDRYYISVIVSYIELDEKSPLFINYFSNLWINIYDYKPIVIVNGNKFILDKNPDNDNPDNFSTIENKDIIMNGWWDSSEYWKIAIFIGNELSNTSDKNNWNSLDSLEDI